MEFKKIEDKELARLIFIQGQLTEDENINNYSVDQFNLGWNDWTSFCAQGISMVHTTARFLGARTSS